MSQLSYRPQNVRRVSFNRLPKGIRDAGIFKIERKLSTGTVTDLVRISDRDCLLACRRFNAVKAIAERPDDSVGESMISQRYFCHGSDDWRRRLAAPRRRQALVCSGQLRRYVTNSLGNRFVPETSGS